MTWVKNAKWRTDALESGLDAMYNNGFAEVRSGAPPGTDAADAGTLLARIPLGADALAAAAAAVKSQNGTPSVAAVGAGVAAHIRLKSAADDGTATANFPRAEGVVAQSVPITSSTWNGGSGKMRVTTSVAHGFATGNKVQIAGHSEAALNKPQWVITVIDADEFDLDGSANVANGAGGKCHNGDAALDNTNIAVGQSVQIDALQFHMPS